REALQILRKVWTKELERLRAALDGSYDEAARRARALLAADDLRALAARRTVIDKAPANGSSIAVLAEYDRRSCLLAGDAHPGILLDALDRVVGPGHRLRVDAVKLPHHGSARNVIEALVRRLQCRHWLFSTHARLFSHPDREAVARVIVHGERGSTLYFNYRTEQTLRWQDDGLMKEWGYAARFPGASGGGIAIDLKRLEVRAE